MTSIVGTWNVRVTWLLGFGGGKELNAFNHTFKHDGTFTHSNGGGRWVQAGDLVIWQWSPLTRRCSFRPTSIPVTH